MNCVCVSRCHFCSTKGESLYEILGIEKGSPPEDIKKAYRRVSFILYLYNFCVLAS